MKIVRNKIREFKVAYKEKDSSKGIWAFKGKRWFYSRNDPIWVQGTILLDDIPIARAEDVSWVARSDDWPARQREKRI